MTLDPTLFDQMVEAAAKAISPWMAKHYFGIELPPDEVDDCAPEIAQRALTAALVVLAEALEERAAQVVSTGDWQAGWEHAHGSLARLLRGEKTL